MTKKNDDGAVSMGHNRLINFLLNTPFPLSKDYELREATNGNGFEIYLSDDKKSDIRKTISGDYAISSVDILRAPPDHAPFLLEPTQSQRSMCDRR